jgi:DNA-binding NarL/FixJ family response regulator
MTSEPQPCRVVIADDDVLLREGLAAVLQQAGFAIAGQAGTPDDLVRVVREQAPDLAIVDIRMPGGEIADGLQAAHVIRSTMPDVAILVLSAHVEITDAVDLLAGGRGVGYLLKSRVTRIGDFMSGIERILEGGSVVDPMLVHELVAAKRQEDRLARLSEREREVLSLMAEGASNAGIARRLYVTEGTVEKHVRSILAKLRLAETPDDHRRVLAVLTFLEAR